MKRMLSLFVVLILILCCSTAYAHSGRTDGRGGHRDHSTGEYHYHHGYPAHDHWDMDGDGKVDCPYLFDDKTGQGSGGSGNSKNTNDDAGVLWFLIGGGLLICLFKPICFFVKELIAKTKNKIKNKKVLAKWGITWVKVPSNVVLREKELPSLGETTGQKPYGGYTVYVSKNGSHFHISNKCSKNLIAQHMFELPQTYSPCKVCARRSTKIPVPEWYTEVRKYVSIRNE